MSKLLVAVVHDLDADQVITALERAGHRVTWLRSTGGFLRIDNTTLLIGIEDEAMPDVMAILERECSSRDIELPLIVAGRLKDELPQVVRHGGATVFVLEVAGIERI
jgi:uncharacterized protein YaaQ